MTLRAEVASTARHLHAAGWVANHDGNVTARASLAGGGDRSSGDAASGVRGAVRYVATPTGTSKRLVTDRDLVEVDGNGAVIGTGKVFGEIGLHLAVYERRPDIGAVIHAHPPNATAIASSRGNPIEVPFIAEALVSLGPLIPKIAYAQPGGEAKAALAPWCELVDAVILGNHGVIAWGKDCETALIRLELVEHLAKIAVAAAAFGGVEPLPASALQPLLAARAKAGIGRAADRALETAAQLLPGVAAAPGSAKPVVACAPAPHAAVATIPPGGAKLADVVREEIVRALRQRD